MCECRKAATCTTKKNFAQFVLTWAKVFSEVISLPSHLVQSQVIKKLLCISQPKPRASAERTARLCYTLPDLKGLGKKEMNFRIGSVAAETAGPSPGQTQMHTGMLLLLLPLGASRGGRGSPSPGHAAPRDTEPG